MNNRIRQFDESKKKTQFESTSYDRIHCIAQRVQRRTARLCYEFSLQYFYSSHYATLIGEGAKLYQAAVDLREAVENKKTVHAIQNALCRLTRLYRKVENRVEQVQGDENTAGSARLHKKPEDVNQFLHTQEQDLRYLEYEVEKASYNVPLYHDGIAGSEGETRQGIVFNGKDRFTFRFGS